MTILVIHSGIYKPFVNLCIIIGLYLSIIKTRKAAIDDQTPSARQFYDRKSIEDLETEAAERREKMRQLAKELDDEEIYFWKHRRRKKRSQQLADWVYELGIVTGMIKHGTGDCKCCTPPDKVKRNEQIWAEKWDQIQKQKKLEKKASGKEKAHKERREKELDRFKEWRLKWGFDWV